MGKKLCVGSLGTPLDANGRVADFDHSTRLVRNDIAPLEMSLAYAINYQGDTHASFVEYSLWTVMHACSSGSAALRERTQRRGPARTID
jgi:hypothetical protein